MLPAKVAGMSGWVAQTLPTPSPSHRRLTSTCGDLQRLTAGSDLLGCSGELDCLPPRLGLFLMDGVVRLLTWEDGSCGFYLDVK